jgi:uncharacterized protein (TIGR03546 family)
MLHTVLQPLRLLVRTFTDAGSPRELGLGLALGVMLGLVPKGNLIAAILAVVLVATRVNLTSAAAGAAVFSWLAVLADPLSHRLGLSLLGWGPLQSTWCFLYNLPIVPWTHFNNTVVLGSLVLGLALFCPVYYASRRVFEHYRPWFLAKLEKYRVVLLLEKTNQVTSWSVP